MWRWKYKEILHHERRLKILFLCNMTKHILQLLSMIVCLLPLLVKQHHSFGILFCDLRKCLKTLVRRLLPEIEVPLIRFFIWRVILEVLNILSSDATLFLSLILPFLGNRGICLGQCTTKSSIFNHSRLICLLSSGITILLQKLMNWFHVIKYRWTENR